MREYKPCKNCGAPAAEKTAGQQVFIECSNLTGYRKEDGAEVPPCGIRTPQLPASLDYGAWDRVAEIWNRSEAGGPGTKGDPLLVPQATYYQENYYLEKGKLYLCFKEYTGSQTPSQMVNNYFALIEE